MSTVLAHIYSDEGFVVAADGINVLRNGAELEITSRDTRKIFDWPGVNRALACTLFGRVTLYDDAGEEPVFNFISASNDASRAISSMPIRDTEEFVGKLAPLVAEKLVALKQDGTLSRYPSPEPKRIGETGSTIVRLFLDGYFDGEPFRTGVRFYNDNQRIGWGSISEHNLGHAGWAIYGSPVIAHLLFDTEDERFKRYRTDASKLAVELCKKGGRVPTLQHAIEIATNYIAACSDPIAIESDPNCAYYGGRIHAAIITPKDGFQWVPGFEPTLAA